MGGSVAIVVTGLFWCAGVGPAPAAERPSVRELAGDLNQLVAPARRLELRLDVSLTASLPQRGNRAGVSLELATRPDLWYAVGVASGTEVAQVEVVTSDGEVKRTVTTSDQALSWSARIFKRIGPLVLSAGVVDSRASIGLELRGWQDRARLELVATDARPLEHHPPTLRAGASVQWRWIYFQGGVQDLSDRDRRAGYLGVGMRWSDPDLRYLTALAGH